MFKLNDKVECNQFGIGEIVVITEYGYAIAWNEYNHGLCESDQYDEAILPEYDDRFYGTFDENDIKKYNIQLLDINPNSLMCPKCGSSLLCEQNGSEAPPDEEWMECTQCNYTRELNDEDIDLIYGR